MKRFHFFSKPLTALVLSLVILLSSFPAFALNSGGSAETPETPDAQEPDVPFSFTLEEGDLAFSELKTAVLYPADIPDVISPALAAERGHVNRLYAQEPDDHTVMFQNRNGSKTIYYFSKPVKQNEIDLSGTEIVSRISNSASSVSLSGNRISFPKDSILPARITQESGRKLNFYNIGEAGIAEWNSESRIIQFVDITKSVRDWSSGNGDAASFELISKSGEPVLLSGGGLLILSIDYSDWAGDCTIKTVPETVGATVKYLMNNYPQGANSLLLSASQSSPRTRWLLAYDNGYFTVRSQSNQLKYILGDDIGGNLSLADYDYEEGETLSEEQWIMSVVSISNGYVTFENSYHPDSFLCHSGTSLFLEDPSYLDGSENLWQLVNINDDFVDLITFTPSNDSVIVETGDVYSVSCTAYPVNVTYQAYELILPCPLEEYDELEFYSDSPASVSVTVKYIYCPAKTRSFHAEIVDYPDSPADFIQSGGKYELFAVEDTSHRSLHYASGSLSYTAYPQNSNANSFVFTYVSNGRYRISPESASTQYLTYLNGGLAVSSYSSSLNQLWYPFKVNNRLYIANGAAHSVVISYSLSGSSVNPCVSDINNCREVALPLAVPLYVQEQTNTCGPCNAKMVIKYFGTAVSENDIISLNPTQFDYVYAVTDAINYYVSSKTYNYYEKISFSESSFRQKIESELNNGSPMLIRIEIPNNSEWFDYSSPGHYVTIKGIIFNNGYKVIINDSHLAYNYEITLPLQVLFSYCPDINGFLIADSAQ